MSVELIPVSCYGQLSGFDEFLYKSDDLNRSGKVRVLVKDSLPENYESSQLYRALNKKEPGIYSAEDIYRSPESYGNYYIVMDSLHGNYREVIDRKVRVLNSKFDESFEINWHGDIRSYAKKLGLTKII